MKIFNDDLTILKNFSQINPNLVVQPGNIIKSVSESKSILAKARTKAEFDSEFGIYDLNEFLSILGMFQEECAEMGIAEDGNSMCISDSSSSATYFFSDKHMLTYPQKEIKIAIEDIIFDLDENSLNRIHRAASALGSTELVVEGTADTSSIELQVRDIKNSTSNVYKLKVDSCTRPEGEFKMIFNIANFKFIPGDYQVRISKNLISHFENKEFPIEYWVALEKSSTIS